MRALNRKLWRDLWQLRAQALAIALVVAAGVATWVMFRTTLDSLATSRDWYYQTYRFADVFLPLERAPLRVAERIAEIPGVVATQVRVVAPVTVDVAGFPELVSGLITSVPDRGESHVNRLYLRTGRRPEPTRDDEVLLAAAFAEAHGLGPGDTLVVNVKGHRKQLRIVGIAQSPEFVNQLRPGGVFPDYKRYAVMWMARTPLSHAWDMDGAFNDVVVRLQAGASVQAVIERLDRLFDRYGGSGAFARKDQLSHRFLTQEMHGLTQMSGIFPAIFIGVAAFLLNVVVTRLVITQRTQVAALKAFGYGNGGVALHYIGMVLVIVLAGVLLGIAAGAWLGVRLSAIYTHFFRLPWLHFVLSPATLVQAGLISAAAGVAGALVAVRLVVQLRPAEAMRPEPPALYRQSLIERIGLQRFLSAPSRMILRHLRHRPLKTLFSVIGLAFAAAILMTGRFQRDTVDFMMRVQFNLAQRQDVTLSFTGPTSHRAVHELHGLPGVLHAEGFRSVPVQLRHEHRRWRTRVLGLPPDATLRRVPDRDLRPVDVPAQGIMLTDYLADLLDVRVGELLELQILEGARPRRTVPVTGLVGEYLGVSGYMRLDALNGLLREGPALSGAWLAVDARRMPALFEAFRDTPRVAGIQVREDEIRNFHRSMDEMVIYYSTVALGFAIIIAVGVVYNAARITLTERNRDLASLRVLGFTRGEISYILLGELAVLTLVALPVGLWLGRGLCFYIASVMDSDLYRLPVVLNPDAYAFSAGVVLAAALGSALLVRRRLDRLDLIAVLKTRE